MIFRSGILRYHRWCWYWKSKVFKYIVWYVFLPRVGKNWIKSYKPNHTKFWALGKTKMVHHFWQRIDVILNDVSVTEVICWCLTINLKTILICWCLTINLKTILIYWCLTINLKTIIFHCSINYGSQTRVILINITPNMTDTVSPWKKSVLTTTKNDRSLRVLLLLLLLLLLFCLIIFVFVFVCLFVFTIP